MKDEAALPGRHATTPDHHLPPRVASVHVVLEGAADFFMGRPFDANPYDRGNAADAWEAWRFGWLEASHLEQMRGDQERRRWRMEAA